MSTGNQMIDRMAQVLDRVRNRRPLVHNITNYVVMQYSANALLAVGAAPVMAHAVEEVKELAGVAGALVLNIGTLSSAWVEGMFLAGRTAVAVGVPVVLDPVGAGATRFRTDTARRLLEDLPPAIVRGNASEILALAGGDFHARGVDSQHSVAQAREAALALAREHRLTVVVTGPEDYVTDGQRAGRVGNGHKLMERITGSGCALSALTGACRAVETDSFVASLAALVIFGIAGELAAQEAVRPGSFQNALLDALDLIDAQHLRRHARFALHVED